ncbi:hypothetical protein D3C87_531820 [compost metagenome]
MNYSTLNLLSSESCSEFGVEFFYGLFLVNVWLIGELTWDEYKMSNEAHRAAETEV